MIICSSGHKKLEMNNPSRKEMAIRESGDKHYFILSPKAQNQYIHIDGSSVSYFECSFGTNCI